MSEKCQKETSDIGKDEIGCRYLVSMPINVGSREAASRSFIRLIERNRYCADINWEWRGAEYRIDCPEFTRYWTVKGRRVSYHRFALSAGR